jgi:TM2 domain-containing membrane protein YozV
MGFFDIAGAVINMFDVPRKERGGAYARLIFLGLVGWHEFYLDKTVRGALYILSFAVLMIGWFSGTPTVQYAGAGALVVFWVFDLVTLWHQVDKWNATHETGNLILNAAGKVASNVISISLKNAAEEYNGVVEAYRRAVKGFKYKKNNVEKLLNELQKARNDALDAVSKMQQILTQIKVNPTDVKDTLGDAGNFSAGLNALLRGDSSMFAELGAVFDSSTQEMQTAFSVVREWTALEGKASAFAAVATTALAAIGEFAKQQEKVQELKQKREQVLAQQNKVENKTMQLEATEKRAQEILKVLNAETKAFNHIYDGFCANVFPSGFTGQKDIRELTLEQRKMFSDLGQALSQVLSVIKQEIRQDSQGTVSRTVENLPSVRSLAVTNGTVKFVDGDFEHKAINGEVIITGYKGSARDVTIPGVIGGLSVTAIGEYAFAGNQLTNVTIPDSVTAIGKGAFMRNQLTSATIPDSVAAIGDWAFNKNQLTSVSIGESVTTIGDWAFQENRLTDVTIGNGVTKIGDWAFQDNRLTSVIIPANINAASDSFPGNLAEVYANEGRQAGTYVSINNGKTWSKQESQILRTSADDAEKGNNEEYNNEDGEGKYDNRW